MTMFRPRCAFKLRTSSTTLLLIKVELCQAEAVVRVVETTYFGMLFMRSPNGSPAGMGSNAPPWICQVLRPSSSASLWRISSKKCAPMSSCQNGQVHPPWVKPPSVSSSAPPGACMTVSNDTNSETTIFRMDSLRIEQQRQAFNRRTHLTYQAGRFGGLRLPPTPLYVRSVN